MENLYDIFIKNLINKDVVNLGLLDRESIYSEELIKFKNSFLEGMDSEKVEMFGNLMTILEEHVTYLRNKDCERVLAVAVTFMSLIHKEMQNINAEEDEVENEVYCGAYRKIKQFMINLELNNLKEKKQVENSNDNKEIVKDTKKSTKKEDKV